MDKISYPLDMALELSPVLGANHLVLDVRVDLTENVIWINGTPYNVGIDHITSFLELQGVYADDSWLPELPSLVE